MVFLKMIDNKMYIKKVEYGLECILMGMLKKDERYHYAVKMERFN